MSYSSDDTHRSRRFWSLASVWRLAVPTYSWAMSTNCLTCSKHLMAICECEVLDPIVIVWISVDLQIFLKIVLEFIMEHGYLRDWQIVSICRVFDTSYYNVVTLLLLGIVYDFYLVSPITTLNFELSSRVTSLGYQVQWRYLSLLVYCIIFAGWFALLGSSTPTEVFAIQDLHMI